MNYLYEIAWYFNYLSDQCDKIRKLDRDNFKHHTDKEILEELLQKKIDSLEE